ncbi:MAG: hypothetical protein KF740_08990 [Ramlibacter sp.]|nr:hypothetical protein [Ramlibacter sp.]
MNFALWFVGAIASGLIGVLLAVAFQDQTRVWLANRIRYFRRSRKRGIEGQWKATFSMNRDENTQSYVEVIEMTSALGVVEGRIVPDDRNYEALKEQANTKPLRIRGEVGESFYLTGVWFHPLDTHRFMGSFQLLLSPSGKEMRGKWLGFSETLGSIDSGEWVFER